MNSFEQLSKRLSSTPWSDSINGYSPSAEEMDGVIRWMKILSELARQGDGKEAQHLLSSPSRILGHRPTDNAAKEIDEQTAKVADAYARVLVKNALEWSDMLSQKELPPSFPPDLFEPLLALLERGCQFRLSKGFLEVGDKAIPVHRWPILSIT